jgi:hypothetical protein
MTARAIARVRRAAPARPLEVCAAAATSVTDPGHVHTCGTTHPDDRHVCTGCRRSFWIKETP